MTLGVLEGKDLFDVLGIGFREDSYSDLLANYFRSDLRGADEFLRQSFNKQPPLFPVRVVKTRLALALEDGRRAMPDLVFFCGEDEDDIREIYWIEAKIEASEGKGQTRTYEKAMLEEANNKGADRVVGGFLTLDGREPDSTVETVTYESLRNILRPELPAFEEYPWMQQAVAALRRRLADYYVTKEKVEHGPIEGKQTLGGFLKQARGLIPNFCAEHGMEPLLIHSGGHAHPEDLAELVRRLAPKAVVPIHTEAAEQFAKTMSNVRVVDDGEAIEIGSLIG